MPPGRCARLYRTGSAGNVRGARPGAASRSRTPASPVRKAIRAAMRRRRWPGAARVGRVVHTDGQVTGTVGGEANENEGAKDQWIKIGRKKCLRAPRTNGKRCGSARVRQEHWYELPRQNSSMPASRRLSKRKSETVSPRRVDRAARGRKAPTPVPALSADAPEAGGAPWVSGEQKQRGREIHPPGPALRFHPDPCSYAFFLFLAGLASALAYLAGFLSKAVLQSEQQK